MIQKGLYRHYKNKLYHLKNIVKHSETLEDLVLYEALYPNELGRYWVRPREMFFESIDKQGDQQPRFTRLPYQIDSIEVIGENELKIISQLGRAIFKNWDEGTFLRKCSLPQKMILLLAVFEGETVGFKLGYEQSVGVFYSWLGGVLEHRRGMGFAQQMMLQQEELCRKQGYKKIVTKTRNKFKHMLLLNIKNGFLITDVVKNAHQEDRIVMVKDLSENV